MIRVSKVASVAAMVVGIGVLSPSLAGMSRAYGEEVSVEKLLLLWTYMKTDDTNLHFAPSAAAFSPTTVRCPRYLTCTMRIEVAAQFANIQQPDVAAAEIRVDGSQDGVLPNATLGLDSENTTIGSSTARTFSWMKKDLGEGTHTVDVRFFTSSGGAADSPNRTLTIQVFRQPSY